jgi:hypothetical protein
VLPPRNGRPCPHVGKVITEDLRPFIYYGFLSRRESCRKPGVTCNTGRRKCCNTAREYMAQHCAREYGATSLDKFDATSVASDNVTINYTGQMHITGWMEGRAATREGARVSRHHARPVLPAPLENPVRPASAWTAARDPASVTWRWSRHRCSSGKRPGSRGRDSNTETRDRTSTTRRAFAQDGKEPSSTGGRPANPGQARFPPRFLRAVARPLPHRLPRKILAVSSGSGPSPPPIPASAHQGRSPGT